MYHSHPAHPVHHAHQDSTVDANSLVLKYLRAERIPILCLVEPGQVAWKGPVKAGCPGIDQGEFTSREKVARETDELVRGVSALSSP